MGCGKVTAYLLCSPSSLEQFIFNTSFNFNHNSHCPLIRCVAYVQTLFLVLHVFLLLPLLTIALLSLIMKVCTKGCEMIND